MRKGQRARKELVDAIAKYILEDEDKEEDANNLVEAISQYYIEIMEYYLNEVIPVSEEKMRASIENVKNLLSDSHTVEEKEDGTVEIKLGGKVYIGKVVEE